ncbi:MAG: hypothetical protein NT013_25280 [Planctomycetia bacterium]|nr:hypothetical protein [Planctomycetia bacterium]
MNRVFERHGLHFEYPEDWILHEQSAADEITVTVNSPETSFWSLTLIFDRPDPYRVVETVIDALREDYSDVDVYTNEDRLGELSAVARDADFVCHELIGSAFIRAAVIPGGTLLVFYQGADIELEETQSLMERISKSLTWEASTEPRMLDVLDLFELAEESCDADGLKDSTNESSAIDPSGTKE